MAGSLKFCPARLKEVREVRGLSQVRLAELVSLTNAAISAYERGKSKPSFDAIEGLANELNVPVDFLLAGPHSPREAVAFYRSLSSASKAARTRAEHRLGWLMDLVAYLERFVEMPPPNLPAFDLPADPLAITDADIETIANAARDHWRLSDGPILNMTHLLEGHGVIVTLDHLESPTLDSLAYRTNERSFVMVSRDKGTAVRWRYDLAHELGHLLLHSKLDQRTVSRNVEAKAIEAQAHKFAGAFLLPMRRFADELYSATLDTLLEMKTVWRVSIGAMISRAAKGGLIGDEAANRLWINYSRRGWRRFEPLDDHIEAEEPRLLAASVGSVLDNGHTVDELREAVHLFDQDIEALCGLPRGYLESARNPWVAPKVVGNVYTFPRRPGMA